MSPELKAKFQKLSLPEQQHLIKCLQLLEADRVIKRKVSHLYQQAMNQSPRVAAGQDVVAGEPESSGALDLGTNSNGMQDVRRDQILRKFRALTPQEQREVVEVLKIMEKRGNLKKKVSHLYRQAVDSSK